MSDDTAKNIADSDMKQWCVLYMTEALNHYDAMQSKRIGMLEESLGNYERISAELLKAYMELAAQVQAIASSLLDDNEEAQTKYKEHLRDSMKTYVETLQHGIKLAGHDTDHFTPMGTSDAERSSDNQESEQL